MKNLSVLLAVLMLGSCSKGDDHITPMPMPVVISSGYHFPESQQGLRLTRGRPTRVSRFTFTIPGTGSGNSLRHRPVGIVGLGAGRPIRVGSS